MKNYWLDRTELDGTLSEKHLMRIELSSKSGHMIVMEEEGTNDELNELIGFLRDLVQVLK